MGSINAKQVAKDVSENIRKGKKVILGEIIRENGYAEQTSLKPKLVTNTQSYQEEIKPIIQEMEKERQRLMKSITTKNLDNVTYRDSINSLDTLTKNIQLLSGGNTEQVQVLVMPQELINKNDSSSNTK